MRFNKSKRFRQNGFTLIELMVASSISAVIALLAYQSIDSVTTMKHSLEISQNRLSELQRAVWKIQQDFLQIVPRSITDSFGYKISAVQLKIDGSVELTRIIEEDSPHESGGLLRVGYQLRDKKLYRVVWDVLDRTPDTQSHSILLLEGVEKFQLTFYDDKHSSYALWPPQLYDIDVLPKSQLTLLPKLIKFGLTFSDKEGKQQSLERYFSTVEGMPIEIVK